MSRNRLPVWKEGREEPGWRTLENSQLEERHGGLRSSCCSPHPSSAPGDSASPPPAGMPPCPSPLVSGPQAMRYPKNVIFLNPRKDGEIILPALMGSSGPER